MNRKSYFTPSNQNGPVYSLPKNITKEKGKKYVCIHNNSCMNKNKKKGDDSDFMNCNSS